MSRRIGGSGDFRGVAVAAIQLRYFSDLYQEVGLGQGTLIVLFHRDGTLLAQHPFEGGEIGQSFADSQLFRTCLPAAAAGVFRAEGPPLPYPRIFSYASLTRQPLVVGVSQSIDVRLKAWRRVALWAGIGAVLMLAMLMLAGFQYARLLRQRQRVRERLQQSETMQALGLLTGGIAHDFGNMLNIVSMNLGLLRRRCADDPPSAAALERVQRAVDSGTQLIRQLMSFSRKRELELVEADLNEAVRSSLPLLVQAAGNQVTVSFEPAPQLDAARLDRAQLESALINLVVNARHAMGAAGRIVLRTGNVERSGGGFSPRRGGRARFVRVTVEDDGPGMTESVRRRALEPFFTTKGDEGTGLGLAQIYGNMQQIGGDVEIDSKVGVGTSVHLYFPAS